MNINKNANLGASFERLKRMLDTTKTVPLNEPEQYSYSLGLLQGAISLHLKECAANEPETPAPDDIPPELFKKPGIYGYNPD